MIATKETCITEKFPLWLLLYAFKAYCLYLNSMSSFLYSSSDSPTKTSTIFP